MICQNLTSKLKSFATRDLEAHDVLRVIDDHRMPVVNSLRATFTEIEAIALKISGFLNVLNIRDLGETVIDIEQSLLELNSQKTDIQKSIIDMTTEDVERALSSATRNSAQRSVLSIDTL